MEDQEHVEKEDDQEKVDVVNKELTGVFIEEELERELRLEIARQMKQTFHAGRITRTILEEVVTKTVFTVEVMREIILRVCRKTVETCKEKSNKLNVPATQYRYF